MKRERIYNGKELAELGKRIARLKGNRDFNEKALKAKMKSLQENGLLVPAIMVDAKDALEAGLEMEDFETGDEVNNENAERYVALLDANHRYKAHLLLKQKAAQGEVDYNGDFQFIYSLQPDVAITKILPEINIATNPWKGADFGKGARMMNPDVELPLLDAINELTDEGFSLEASSLWNTFGSKVTKSVLAKAMHGEITEALKQETGIERGRKILNAVKKSFGAKFIKTRTLVDWVVAKYDNYGDGDKGTFTPLMEEFFNTQFTRDKAEEIEKMKGKRGVNTKEQLINEELNRMWEAYTAPKRVA